MFASPVILGRKAMQPPIAALPVTEKIPNAALVAETAERIAEAGISPNRCREAMNMRHPKTDFALFDRDRADFPTYAESHDEGLADYCACMSGGTEALKLIHDGKPVYSAPLRWLPHAELHGVTGDCALYAPLAAHPGAVR